MKGATIPFKPLFGQQRDFNPRSREGSDSEAEPSGLKLVISIHAPVKGATCGLFQGHAVGHISIHAPVKGATQIVPYALFVPWFQSTLPWRERPVYSLSGAMVYDFNPRSREGSDASEFTYYDYRRISIHAPVKGATCAGVEKQSRSLFQSTLPWRERLSLKPFSHQLKLFQSTLPWRERRFS